MATVDGVTRRHPSVGISFTLDVACRCVACGADRELPDSGRQILKGESSIVAEAENPCGHCGERRVKVSWAVGLEG